MPEQTAVAVRQNAVLAKIEKGDTLMLTTPRDIQAAIEGFKAGGYNVVCPVASIGNVPPMHAVTFRAVKIDLKECYQDRRFCGPNEYALKGDGLNKLAAAAGVNIVSRQRLDNRQDPHLAEVEITIAMRDFDGQIGEITKAKTMDLRDGAEEALVPEKDAKGNRTGKLAPMEPLALADKRRHIQSHAETKAYYRALRAKLIVQQKYTAAELTRPFVVPALVPALDPSDPDQKKALIEQASSSVRQLYGHQKDRDQAAPRRELKAAFEPAVTMPIAPIKVPVAAPQDEYLQELPPEEEAAADDFEAVEVPPAPKAPSVCTCPCGCQLDLKPETVTTTTEIVGAPRCRECFPGAAFNFKKHEDLADLALPKKPGMTAADWKRGMEARKKR